MSETRHTTRPEDASADAGWYRMSRGYWVTRRPLAGGLLFARLTYRDALTAARLLGGMLPSREQVIEVIVEARSKGHVLAPVTLSHGPEMVTLAHSEEHDRRVMTQLTQRGVRDDDLVAGIGKHWVRGATPGRSRICGWPRADGTLIQQGLTDIHGDDHHDYGTTTIVVSDGEPGKPVPANPPDFVDALEAEAAAHRIPSAARIRQYLAPATRIIDGREMRVGIATGDHCAAGMCFVRASVAPDVSTWPHRYRVACWELIDDARRLMTWREATSGYVPSRGDVVLQTRTVRGRLSDPRQRGAEGHVGVAMGPPVDGRVRCIEANGPGRAWHTPLRSSEIVGYITARCA